MSRHTRDGGSHGARSGASGRAAFSLIEVLIAVVVLAFGLLGLAAVFPTVVRQQTTAKDQIQGVSVARSGEEYLLGNAKLNAVQTLRANVAADWFSETKDRVNRLDILSNRLGWQSMTAQNDWGVEAGNSNFEARWPRTEAVDDVLTSRERASVAFGRVNGDLAIGRPKDYGGWIGGGVVIPISQRLIPAPYSGARPEYVWDFVARRVPSGRPHDATSNAPDARARQALDRLRFEDDLIEAVIFVRRIDAGIRANATGNRPADEVLSDLLTGRGSATRPVLALGEDARGVPTLDGTGAGYSSPKRLVITGFPLYATIEDLSTITIDSTSSDGERAQPFVVPRARQVGQKLVDTLGVVHTVREVRTRDADDRAIEPPQIVVDPPFDPKVHQWWQLGLGPELVFTTQIPASVSVVRIDPRRGGV